MCHDAVHIRAGERDEKVATIGSGNDAACAGIIEERAVSVEEGIEPARRPKSETPSTPGGTEGEGILHAGTQRIAEE